MRCPGLDGSFGVMANHQEGMFALDIGEVKISFDKSKQYFATGGGFAEIINGKVKLLVESIEASSDINMDRAKKSLERAQERKQNNIQGTDMVRVESAILRAINRLKISKR